jgi:hypothetical protein
MHTIEGPGSLIRRPDAISPDYTYAHLFGPVQLSDFSLGLYNRPWRVRVDNAAKTIYLARANDANTAWEAETVVLVFAGVDILELDAAFDQQGRIFLCAERATGTGGASEVWIYFFNSLLGAYVFTDFGAGRTPRAILDDPLSPNTGDVLVFYIRDAAGLCWRQQRDRFAVEFVAVIPGAVFDAVHSYIEDVYRAIDGRLHVLYSVHDLATGRYNLFHYETVLYPWFMESESWTMADVPRSGTLPSILQYVGPAGTLNPSGFPLDGYDEVDPWKFSALPQNGLLPTVRFFHTLFDHDDWKFASVPLSGSVPQVLFFHTLFDHDDWKIGAVPLSGTVPQVLFLHTLFDIDTWKMAASPLSGTLV